MNPVIKELIIRVQLQRSEYHGWADCELKNPKYNLSQEAIATIGTDKFSMEDFHNFIESNINELLKMNKMRWLISILETYSLYNNKKPSIKSCNALLIINFWQQIRLWIYCNNNYLYKETIKEKDELDPRSKIGIEELGRLYYSTIKKILINIRSDKTFFFIFLKLLKTLTKLENENVHPLSVKSLNNPLSKNTQKYKKLTEIQNNLFTKLNNPQIFEELNDEEMYNLIKTTLPLF